VFTAGLVGTPSGGVPKILGGKFTEVSLERLMRFLSALGYHIEIRSALELPIRPERLR
jgi:hypothetical protein